MGVPTPQTVYKPVMSEKVEKKSKPKRGSINIYIVISFILIYCGWITINYTHLTKENLPTVVQDDHFINILDFTNQTILSLPVIRGSGVKLIVWLAMSGPALFLLLLKTLNCLAIFWTLVGLVIVAIVFSLHSYYLSMMIYSFIMLEVYSDTVEKMWHYSFDALLEIAIILFLGMSLKCAWTAKLRRLVDIISKTSQTLFSTPLILFFGTFVVLICTTLTAFTAFCFYCMDSSVSGVLGLIGGIYVTSVFYYFVVCVICQCMIMLGNSKTGEQFSGHVLHKAVVYVVSNDFGAILFLSTWILPVMCIPFMSCTERVTTKYPNIALPGLKASFVKWWLIAHNFIHAIPLLSSHPEGIQEATEKVYRLFTRSLAVLTSSSIVLSAIIIAFHLIGMLISVGLSFALFQDRPLSIESFTETAIMYDNLGFFSYALAFPIILVAAAITTTFIDKEFIDTINREIVHPEIEEIKLDVIDQTQIC